MRRKVVMALATAGVLALPLLPGVSAEGAQEPEKIYKVIPYVVSDAELVKNPEKLSEEFSKRFSLDHLGIQPATADGPSVTTRPRTASGPVSYVVDSSRFPGGSKPADIYDYATEQECDDNSDRASDDAGWIKNRFSYCQIHVIYLPAVECVIPPVIICRMVGEFISVNTLRGRGKAGGHGNDPGKLRWAEFLLEVDVTKKTGVFGQPTALLKASIECHGAYRSPVVPTDPDFACFPGTRRSVLKPVIAWNIDEEATFEILSEGVTPDAANGEQIAVGVFRIKYDFEIPWFFQFIPTAGPEGGMRFDSAWYLNVARAELLGSVFDRAVPGLSLNKNDPRIAGAAEHIEQARANPASTVPTKIEKVLHGGTPGDPLHRLPGGKSAEHRTRLERNRDVAKNFCNTRAMPSKPEEGGPFDCDEYALASTYEGAARWEFDNDPALALDYSVRWVNSEQNQEAGKRYGRWYDTDRVLDREEFFTPIVAGDGGGGGGGPGPVDNPPRVNAGADRLGNEGVSVILHGAADDDVGITARTWSYSAGPDVDAGATCTLADAHTEVTTMTCTDDGTFTVSLTASDGVNPDVSDSATVTLRNVAPAIGGEILPPFPAAASALAQDEVTLTPRPWEVFKVGDPVPLRAAFSDPGTNDTQTCDVNWDDGATEVFAAQDNACERRHVFTHAGMFTIAVTAGDDDGGVDREETMVVVYDPDAGFVTGGGHLAMADTGSKGHFQFNPKYHKDDPGPVPTGGKAQFRVDGTDFTVESTSFEWLVVTPDARIALKGTATVGGQEGYGFVLYAYEPDRYRIVVWDLDTGPNPGQDKVFDNRPLGGYDLDLADPQQITAGNITIHR